MGQLVKNNNDSSNNLGEAAPISITKARKRPDGSSALGPTCINPAAGPGGHPTLRAQLTPRRERQAPRSGFPAPNPAKLATCVEEEGKFWGRSSKPLCLRGGRRGGQGDGSPGSGARNSEARRFVPGPAGRRTLLKDKWGQPWAPARRSRLTQACRPKPPRSSSKQAAGRARPGRGPRVPRKLQAAQVEPGRRHRKSRVSSEPRTVLPAATAGGCSVHRDPGGGWVEGRVRAGRGNCGGQPCAAEAEQICSPRSTLPTATWGAAETGRPTALGRLAGAPGDRTRRRRYRGLGLLRPRRLSLFCRDLSHELPLLSAGHPSSRTEVRRGKESASFR
ncbi:hypothetical protein E2I00_007862 [Balaenoptera physalus]|uniref:Uncharacterized protein n=1 Tax=Balaenoptera physalus TaxID=9770 RepID=A0A6A1Q9N2_BALPH|nr:hypothetical protein E2I00_007862 [Balaenoptera physalus]